MQQLSAPRMSQWRTYKTRTWAPHAPPSPPPTQLSDIAPPLPHAPPPLPLLPYYRCGPVLRTAGCREPRSPGGVNINTAHSGNQSGGAFRENVTVHCLNESVEKEKGEMGGREKKKKPRRKNNKVFDELNLSGRLMSDGSTGIWLRLLNLIEITQCRELKELWRKKQHKKVSKCKINK